MPSTDKPDKIKDPEAFYQWFYQGVKRFISVTVLEIGGSNTKYVYVPDATKHNIKKGEEANAVWIDKDRLLHLLNNTHEYDNKNILVITFKGDKINETK